MSLLSAGWTGLPHSGSARRGIPRGPAGVSPAWLLLAADLDPLGSGRALDHPRGRLDVVGRQVGHLDRGDLADLFLRDPADRLALRRGGALVDPGRLAEEVRGGWALQDERERPILEHGD